MKQPETHLHGGNAGAVFRRLGIPEREIIDFSVNVNPFGPPDVLSRNWHGLQKLVHQYPDVNGSGVAAYYAHKFGLDSSSVLPGNGSTECIYLVPRVMGFKKVAIVTPSFHDYERACRLIKAEVVDIPLPAVKGFSEPDAEALAEYLQNVDAIMFGNPNNPTGTLFNRETILQLAESYPDTFVLVDEAFSQFLDDFENRTLLNPDLLRRNILVFHSLTKLYDIPGIRLGAAVGHPETIRRLAEFKEPWTINGIAEKTASLLTGCSEYESHLKQHIRKEQDCFIKEFSKLQGITLFPSRTNFMLARWTATQNLDDLIRFLLENGIHIRDCRNFRHLEDNYFRFAILGSEENNKLTELVRICCHSHSR